MFLGSGVFGDTVAFTVSEEFFSTAFMIVGRCFVAFLFAEAASYV
jgi:hypothetical protein